MVPKDLSGFSVEQLRGFATAATQEIASLKSEAKGDPDKLSALEQLLDDRDRLSAAIEAALAADDVEASVDAAISGGDGDSEEGSEGDAGDDDSDDDAGSEGEGEGGDVVDEAVASMTLGGGDRPGAIRVNEPHRSVNDIKKFIRRMANGGSSHEEKHQFTTMHRETKHIVRAGQNATEAFASALASRVDGSDKTAAACFCGPDDAITAIKECGETVRPFSDTLPTVTATGDVRYIRQIDLADALTGVGQWACADQALVDPEVVATWKPCFELDCPAEQTSALYAVAACASFSTQQLVGNENLIANLEHVMQVAFSKTAELLVYNRVRTLSSQYTYGLSTAGYGASAQLLSAVGWALELIKANLRESNPRYTLALPAGLIERVLTDGLIRGTDDYRTRDDLLDRLDTLGIANVVELVDEVVGTPPPPSAHATPAAPGGPAVPAPAHPVEQQILLYRPEDFILGVGPDIDLGITRSPELARQNKLQWFTEGFEFVEKVGCAPAIDLVVPFCASGIRPALGDGEDCGAAYV